MKRMGTIFDMDGVISDNMGYHTRAWEMFIQRHAPHLGIGDVTPHYGKTNADLMGFVFGRALTPEEVELYGEEKEGLYRELYTGNMAPLPGLFDLLKELRKSGIRTGVATSAPKSNVDFLLDGLGFRDCFDLVIDAAGVRKGKPDPEIYLKSARELGCEPAACVVFEDALAGIEAGRRAGMRVVGVATTLPPERLSQTDLVIRDFREITVFRIIELLAPRSGRNLG
jgi:HAD superfamily hydrolase (TIGR01509 family)